MSEWFDSRRGLVLGITLSGSSAGAVVWPLVLGQLPGQNGPSELHRLVAITSLPILILSCLLIRERRGVAGHDAAGERTNISQRGCGKAILDHRFATMCFSIPIMFSGYMVLLYFIPQWACQKGMRKTKSHELLRFANAGCFFGRIIFGWLADQCGRSAPIFHVRRKEMLMYPQI